MNLIHQMMILTLSCKVGMNLSWNENILSLFLFSWVRCGLWFNLMLQGGIEICSREHSHLDHKYDIQTLKIGGDLTYSNII